jgi:hypothetical protein
MKSIIKNGESAIINYPCLKHTFWDDGSQMVVLFNSKNTGVVVYSSNNRWVVGEHNATWAEYQFRSFNGTIELSNN